MPPDNLDPLTPAAVSALEEGYHFQLRRADEFEAALVMAQARIAELEGQLAASQAVVERLEKTADGSPITPRMAIYCPLGHKCEIFESNRAYCCKGDCWCAPSQGTPGCGTHYDYDQCFSTAEAAAVAAPAGGGAP